MMPDREPTFKMVYAESIRNSAKEEPTAEFVMTKLSNTSVDPRKILGFLVTGHGQAFISQIGSKSKLEPVVQRVEMYSRQHPQNQDMKEAVASVKERVAALPGP